MRRHRTLPVVILLSLTVLAGCADDGTKKSSSTPSSSSASASSAGTSSAGASGSASPSTPDAASTSPAEDPSNPTAPTDAPTLPNVRIEAANLHVAVLGENAASTSEEKAVVNAWMAYWQGAADTYYYYRPSKRLLGFSRGKARSTVLAYLAQTKSDKQRVVGWARDNVTSVKVHGSSATVRDCTKNFTFSVDQEAEPVTKPTPYYDVTGELTRVDGRWVVSSQVSKELNKTCLS